MELLWVRDAWALATGDPEAPPPLTDAVAAAPPGVSPAERAEWDAAWPDLGRAAVHHAGLEADHERGALDALAPAWERGLTTIVTIPCRGEYTRVIGDHALLVTDETHEDLPRYRQALARFPGGPAIGAAARGARK